MKLLIFGATGMLGQALLRIAQDKNYEAVGIARAGADISLDICNSSMIRSAFLDVKPDIVINAAAITNLAECENNPGYAYQVNSRSVAMITELCRTQNVYFVQISTDHYYTGDGSAEHKENHKICLLNEYARTKFAGESFAMTYEQSLVVRTNIVGFRGKKDQPTFVEWVINTLDSRSPITLFNDFYTSSVDVLQFSEALLEILKKRPTGLLNLASKDVSNKETFIRALAAKMGYSIENAKIGSVNANNNIVRAESLGLDVSKAENIIGRPLPSLSEVIDQLVAEYYGGMKE